MTVLDLVAVPLWANSWLAGTLLGAGAILNLNSNLKKESPGIRAGAFASSGAVEAGLGVTR